jgi:hypothetical protein
MVLSLLHLPTPEGTAGAMGRIELVRLGGLPGIGGSEAFCSALSSQEDLVGDQRLRARESVLIDVDIRLGGVTERSIGGGEVSTGFVST